MLAFVLSGGGNRGAIQVGALQVLFEAGIQPDLIVGTSIGAINGTYLAIDPTVRASYELADIWRRVTRANTYPGNRLTAVWSLLRGREGLFPNQAWYNFINAALAVKTFGEIKGCQVRVVATDLATATLVSFGDDPALAIVDALMASTALPPLHAPWTIKGRKYIDGGAVAGLPLRVALDLGAQTIFALHIVGPVTPVEQIRSVLGVANQAVGALLRQQLLFDIERARGRKNVRLYEIKLSVDFPIAPWDFSHTDELIDIGREITKAFLASTPLHQPTLRERLANGFSRVTAPAWSAGTSLVSTLWPKPQPAESEAGLSQ
ncbi:MAG: patatin-like phospholipase family protein [Ardenticatenaceae bacterium]|nr:patatin-like phospholipase family protein [Ardenticatenaceae bacterium]